MYFVYIHESKITEGKDYYGYSTDLRKRIRDHDRGHGSSAKKIGLETSSFM